MGDSSATDKNKITVVSPSECQCISVLMYCVQVWSCRADFNQQHCRPPALRLHCSHLDQVLIFKSLQLELHPSDIENQVERQMTPIADARSLFCQQRLTHV